MGIFNVWGKNKASCEHHKTKNNYLSLKTYQNGIFAVWPLSGSSPIYVELLLMQIWKSAGIILVYILLHCRGARFTVFCFWLTLPPAYRFREPRGIKSSMYIYLKTKISQNRSLYLELWHKHIV